MKPLIVTIGLGLALAACASENAPKGPVTASNAEVEPGEMVIDTLAGGGFAGRAGALWTEAEIGTYLKDSECSGKKPAVLSVTKTSSGHRFSGRC